MLCHLCHPKITLLFFSDWNHQWAMKSMIRLVERHLTTLATTFFILVLYSTSTTMPMSSMKPMITSIQSPDDRFDVKRRALNETSTQLLNLTDFRHVFFLPQVVNHQFIIANHNQTTLFCFIHTVQELYHYTFYKPPCVFIKVGNIYRSLDSIVLLITGMII